MAQVVTFTASDGRPGVVVPAPGLSGADVLSAVPAGATNVQVVARADYVAPVEVAVPESITFAQLLIGLVAEGWITEAEGDAWLAGTLPAAALAVIATLPEAQRFGARTRALRPSVVVRSDPLVIALAASEGITSEQLDQFFITYSQV